MSLKRIFWSILAGVSLSVAACEPAEPMYGVPEYGPPPDSQEDADAEVEDITEEE